MTNDNQQLKLKANNKYITAMVQIPGSKSITNRALLLAALANGVSSLHNVPDNADDVALMINALKQLGVQLELILPRASQDVASYRIYGCNGVFPRQHGEIFCGNSGTTLRFLTAALALQENANYTLLGIERMHERPIGDLIDALRQINCNISYMGNVGYPPLHITAREKSLDTQCPKFLNIKGNVSSQFVSSILLSLSILKNPPQIKIVSELISAPYVDMTIALLQEFKNACEYTIEPDASSASYFLSLGAIGGDITIANLGRNSIQGDVKYAEILESMGAIVEYNDDKIRVTKGKLRGGSFNMQNMPDVAMTLAITALFAEGITHISGIASWKLKETDRILAMYNELTKLGAKVNYTDDSITITPPDKISPNIAINTYDDHRMAMCFSLLAVAGVDVIINNPQCVNKTFPSYFSVFQDMLCFHPYN